MKIVAWNSKKNKVLKAQRGVSFEDAAFHISAGDVLDTVEHPNQERYPGQRIHILSIDDYVYLVPFVETEDEMFLKTIIPSRKATRDYGGKSNE